MNNVTQTGKRSGEKKIFIKYYTKDKKNNGPTEIFAVSLSATFGQIDS